MAADDELEPLIEEMPEAPERGSAAELMDHGVAGDPLGPMRHSAAHVLAEAVMDLFPGTKLGIGPVITDGFYYDFLLPRPLTPDDLPAIEARMRRSIAADHPFEFSEEAPEAARAALVERDQPFKVEIVDDLRAASERDGTPMPPTTFYRQGPFIDLCRGPHVASTGRIGPFQLLGTAGAYWRGDETRPMLQRVYGTAWATQETSTPTCGGARRPRSATTAGWASRSTSSRSTMCRRARRSGTPRASASGGPSRAPCASSRTGAATRRSRPRSS